MSKFIAPAGIAIGYGIYYYIYFSITKSKDINLYKFI